MTHTTKACPKCRGTHFCSAKCLYEWQEPLTEDEIIRQTGGCYQPYARCQWCACTLKSGYHDTGCPVRDYAKQLRAS